MVYDQCVHFDALTPYTHQSSSSNAPLPATKTASTIFFALFSLLLRLLQSSLLLLLSPFLLPAMPMLASRPTQPLGQRSQDQPVRLELAQGNEDSS